MQFSILLISQNLEKRGLLEEFLEEQGHHLVSMDSYSNDLILKRISASKIELLLFYLTNPTPYLLKTLRLIQDKQPSPIIVFTETEDTKFVADCIKAGASSFVFDGISKHRLPSIIEESLARFNKCQKTKKKLEHAERRLEERRDIDRAKGILMKNKGITEEDAYSRLRTTAMSKNLRIGELAKSIINASELLEN